MRARVLGVNARMQVTKEMTDALAWLHQRGMTHAKEEMRRMGVKPRRPHVMYAELPKSIKLKFEAALHTHLGSMNLRIASELAGANEIIGADLTQMSKTALVRSLNRKVKGAGTIAAAITSGAFDAGLAETYEANEDQFTSWVYTAVMDAATCDVCGAMDGTEYASLEEAYADMPDFGPNPECFGGDRCRCRLVPLDTTGGGGGIGVQPFAPTPQGQGAHPVAELPPGLKQADMNAAVEDADRTTKADYIWRVVPDVSRLLPGAKTSKDLLGKEVMVKTHLTGTVKQPLGTPAPGAAVLRITVPKDTLLGRVKSRAVLPPGHRLKFTQYDPLCARLYEDDAVEYADAISCPVMTHAHKSGRPFAHYKDATLKNTAAKARRGLKKLGEKPAAEWTADDFMWHLRFSDRGTQYEYELALRDGVEVDRPYEELTDAKLQTDMQLLYTHRANLVKGFPAEETKSGALLQIQAIDRDLAELLQEVDIRIVEGSPSAAVVPAAAKAPMKTVKLPAKKPMHLGDVGQPIPEIIGRVTASKVAGDEHLGRGLREGISYGSAPTAKHEVTLKLEERLRDDPDWKKLWSSGELPRDGYGRQYTMPQEHTAAMVGQWAMTSADDSVWSLLLQRATAAEFGIPEKNLKIAMRRMSDFNKARVDGLWANHEAGLRAFVRAMYEQTQEELRAMGIDEVVLYRGMSAKPKNMLPGFNRGHVTLQPASSFATNLGTARGFGSNVLTANVPRERILGTARTGFGCLNEYEYVVLGTDTGDEMLVWTSGGYDSAPYDAAAFWEKGLAGVSRRESGLGVEAPVAQQPIAPPPIAQPAATGPLEKTVGGLTWKLNQTIAATDIKTLPYNTVIRPKLPGGIDGPAFQVTKYSAEGVQLQKLKTGEFITLDLEKASAEWKIVAWEPGLAGKTYADVLAPDEFSPDWELDDADWTKQTWDLPASNADELRAWLAEHQVSVAAFKRLPAYRLHVDAVRWLRDL